MDAPHLAQPNVGNFFSLETFLNRYIAGDVCLKECRLVSRQRLSIASINLKHGDYLAELLNDQIRRFNYAIRELDNPEINIGAILAAHKIVSPSTLNKLRSTNSWIGISREDAVYIPPPPSKIVSQLALLIDYLNDERIPADIKAINAYATFTRIHPMDDGNGRISRVLYAWLAGKSTLPSTHFSIYRFKTSNQSYIDFLGSREIGDFSYHTHTYWLNALRWLRAYDQKAMELFQQHQKNMLSKVGMLFLDRIAQAVLHLFWDHPCLTPNDIVKRARVSMSKCYEILITLSSIGIVEKTRLSGNSSDIYTNRAVFKFWNELDMLVTKNK